MKCPAIEKYIRESGKIPWQCLIKEVNVKESLENKVGNIFLRVHCRSHVLCKGFLPEGKGRGQSRGEEYIYKWEAAI